MANPNYDNVILGSGIAGLTVFYYLTEFTKTRNLLITNNIASQTNTKFPLGPRYLHTNKDTEILLKKLGFPTSTKEVFIGYKYPNGEIRNFADDDFKKEYAKVSRGTSKVEGSFLSGGGKSNFTAFTVSQVALGKSLLNRCLDKAEKSEYSNLIIDNIKNVEQHKITTEKNTYYANNIISTIPLTSLLKLMSHSSLKIKLDIDVDTVNFFLVDEKNETKFDYIYSVDNSWYRKTYFSELSKYVYETHKPELFLNEFSDMIVDRVTMNTQISKSIGMKELGDIKLVGRFGQMNHSIKTEDVIHWAHAYTRKFKKNE